MVMLVIGLDLRHREQRVRSVAAIELLMNELLCRPPVISACIL